MAYLFEHTKFGFCWLDLLALLILLAVIVVFGVRNRDLKSSRKIWKISWMTCIQEMRKKTIR